METGVFFGNQRVVEAGGAQIVLGLVDDLRLEHFAALFGNRAANILVVHIDLGFVA